MRLKTSIKTEYIGKRVLGNRVLSKNLTRDLIELDNMVGSETVKQNPDKSVKLNPGICSTYV